MAWHRLQHAKTRINELEKLKNKNEKPTVAELQVVVKSEPQTIKSEPR